MNRIEKESHAKINLALNITGRREDGYHTLATVMQEISLSDRITLEPAETIRLVCNRQEIPTDEKNLCIKAAKAYFEAAGVNGGCLIDLYKKIPSGAGLGGGSSNAAATLEALEELFKANVDLYTIAGQLGADVPFFLTGGTCLCTGIGEIVTPLFFPGKKDLWCVIAKGETGLSTPAVYAAFDTLPAKEAGADLLSLAEAMTWGAPEAVYPFLHNDLEAAAVSLLPEIRETRTYLKALSAEATLMSGSGSAVFGLFRDRDAAAWAAANVKNRGKETFLCRLL